MERSLAPQGHEPPACTWRGLHDVTVTSTERG